MGGKSIELAREAMMLFLKSLPNTPTLRFNIVGFGSEYEMLWQHGSQPYNQQTLQEAQKHVTMMQADLGGTEILQPLEAILSKPVLAGAPRQIILLTDGNSYIHIYTCHIITESTHEYLHIMIC